MSSKNPRSTSKNSLSTGPCLLQNLIFVFKARKLPICCFCRFNGLFPASWQISKRQTVSFFCGGRTKIMSVFARFEVIEDNFVTRVMEGREDKVEKTSWSSSNQSFWANLALSPNRINFKIKQRTFQLPFNKHPMQIGTKRILVLDSSPRHFGTYAKEWQILLRKTFG